MRDMNGDNNPNYRHGMRETRFYEIWAGMKKRCNDLNHPDYGSRGITYQDSWEDFENFKEDMFNSYSEGLTLERKDVNGNYCKENCEWIPRSQQARNQRKRNDNKSGVVGVCRNLNFNRRVNKAYPCWTANWRTKEGLTRSKKFSIDKYGEDLAFKLACEYRQKIIQQLEAEGVVYADSHGK